VENIKISSDAFAGASYLDKTASPPAQTKATGTDVAITKETDSVYAGVSGEVLLADSERARPLKIVNQLGWSDTVVWNPYGDEGMGYDQFVCVESAQASSPVKLTPGEYWTGAMDVVP
jgi:glucose-6-phosphate 1-epimerase